VEFHAPSTSNKYLDRNHLRTTTVLGRRGGSTGSHVAVLAARVAAAAFVAALALSNPASAQSSSASTAPLPQVYSTQIVNSEDIGVVAAKGKTTEVTAAPKPTKPITTSQVVVSILPPPATIAVNGDESTGNQKKKKKKKKDAPVTDPSLIESAIGFSDPVGTTTTSAPKAPVAKKLKASSAEPDVPSDAVVAKADTTDTAMTAAFAALRKCESGGNYKTNTGNGYFGAYQFAVQTWRALGFSGLPSDATPETQDEAARKLQAKAGWGQWPACSRKLGLR
jgi:Transglycosylase-like domain